MLRTHTLNRFTTQSNSELVGTYYKTQVTAGNGSKGAWVQVTDVASANPTASNDAYGILFRVYGSSSTATRPTWMDVGVDTAGGTAYQPVINNLQVGAGATGNYVTMGRGYFFPLFVPRGSTVALRGQSVSAASFQVGAQIFTAPTNPANIWVGKYSETIGTTTASLGTTYTPGNGAYGSWTSLGTTTRSLQYFQLGVHCNNTVVNGYSQVIDLAYGDGTNFVPIISAMRLGCTSTEEFYHHVIPAELCFRDVPAGSTLYIRSGASTAPDTGWHAMAIGLGG